MWVALGIAVFALSILTRANFSSQAVSLASVDLGIDRAIQFLADSHRFDDVQVGAGTNPIEIWLVRQSLAAVSANANEAHSTLSATIDRAWHQIRAIDDWGVFLPLPGEPPLARPAARRAEIREYITVPGRSPEEELWNLWMIAGLHANFGELYPSGLERFLGNDWRDWYGYPLTHRFLAYRFMQEQHPEHAARLGVNEAAETAALMIALGTHVDFFLSDLYLERVAFLLSVDDCPRHFRDRWIERALAAQNEDGGWSFHRAPTDTLLQLLGLTVYRSSRISGKHPTILALYALTRYRAGHSCSN